MNNFAGHGIGQRNVAAHVHPQPRVGPLRRTRPTRIDHVELRAVANPFQYVMEENRVRLQSLYHSAVKVHPQTCANTHHKASVNECRITKSDSSLRFASASLLPCES